MNTSGEWRDARAVHGAGRMNVGEPVEARVRAWVDNHAYMYTRRQMDFDFWYDAWHKISERCRILVSENLRTQAMVQAENALHDRTRQ